MSRLLARPHRRRRPARNIEIKSLLDTLFVSAIATILVIRLQLWATNYPKLGSGKLHIAHLLWGGLAMLVAIVLLLSFIGRRRRHTAAFIGGVGFGFFIDELGKFITSNNDYFFKPAAGIIYIVFIALFLVIRSLAWRRRFTPEECLANAIVLLSQAADGGLTESERTRVRLLLARAPASDPMVEPLEQVLAELECRPELPPGRFVRFGRRLRAWYFEMIKRPWFPAVLVGVFALSTAVTVVQVAFDAARVVDRHQHLHVITAGSVAFSIVACGLVVRGLIALRHDGRLAAYRWFDYALMVEIFFTEVFAFLENQFGAVFGLLFDLALLLTLRAMIHAEEHGVLYGADAPEASADELTPPVAAASETVA
jgi:hypothetical protein